MSANQPQVPSLDQLLADANVLTPEVAATFESEHGFDELFDRIVTDDAPAPAPAAAPEAGRKKVARRRPSRRTIASLALAATIVAGGATAAAAGWTSIHTGTFGHRGDTEDVPGEEFFNLAADDMPRVALGLAKGIPFAPGDSAQAYIPGLPKAGEMQPDGIREYLTGDALCGWWGYWLQSNEHGDAAGRAQATAILQQAPTWPIVVQSDGGGTVAFYRQIAAGARSGQPAIIQQAFTANCTGLPEHWASK